MNSENLNITLEIVLSILLIISELLPFCTSEQKGIIHSISINFNLLYKNIQVKPSKIQTECKRGDMAPI